jgi:hypothetical protein
MTKVLGLAIGKECMMCPACLATISMILAGAFSTGGVAVLAAKTLLRKKERASEGPVASREEFLSVEKKETTS